MLAAFDDDGEGDLPAGTILGEAAEPGVLGSFRRAGLAEHLHVLLFQQSQVWPELVVGGTAVLTNDGLHTVIDHR